MDETREIINVLKKDMSSARTICRYFEEAQIEIIYDFFNTICNKFQDKLIN